MAEQSIKIKIGSKEYNMKASSPEQERIIRLAAESINKMADVYRTKYPAQQEYDRIAFVALNNAISLLTARKELSDSKAECQTFLEQTQAYLDNIEK